MFGSSINDVSIGFHEIASLVEILWRILGDLPTVIVAKHQCLQCDEQQQYSSVETAVP